MSLEKFFLSARDSILVIIDIQEKLARVMEKRQSVIKNVQNLIEMCKLFTIPIIITEQYPKGLGQTVEEIRNVLPEYKPIEKLSFNCCEESIFLETIKGYNKKNILLTGMETHICVLQTALGLLREGYHVHVVSDAVCSRSWENHQTGIEFIRSAGAVITCTETVLFQNLKIAGTEEFKVISKLVK